MYKQTNNNMDGHKIISTCTNTSLKLSKNHLFFEGVKLFVTDGSIIIIWNDVMSTIIVLWTVDLVQR